MLILDKEQTNTMKTMGTKAFGTIEIDTDTIYSFRDGLYGFVDETEFALIEGKNDSPFIWLQSTTNEHLAFILIDPLMLMNEYRPLVIRSDIDALQVSEITDCRIFVIVTIPQNAPEEMTVNLQGPILLNQKLKIGRQVISDDDKHGVRISALKLIETEGK